MTYYEEEDLSVSSILSLSDERYLLSDAAKDKIKELISNHAAEKNYNQAMQDQLEDYIFRNENFDWMIHRFSKYEELPPRPDNEVSLKSIEEIIVPYFKVFPKWSKIDTYLRNLGVTGWDVSYVLGEFLWESTENPDDHDLLLLTKRWFSEQGCARDLCFDMHIPELFSFNVSKNTQYIVSRLLRNPIASRDRYSSLKHIEYHLQESVHALPCPSFDSQLKKLRIARSIDLGLMYGYRTAITVGLLGVVVTGILTMCYCKGASLGELALLSIIAGFLLAVISSLVVGIPRGVAYRMGRKAKISAIKGRFIKPPPLNYTPPQSAAP